MIKLTGEHKKTFSEKLIQFQKNGWKDYKKYLEQQLKIAEKARYHESYKKYITSQIELSNKRIKALEEKLK